MAVGGDAERLVVLLEARIRDFEKNMQKANGTATRSYDRMRRGSSSATAAMERDMVRSTGRINQALAATSAKIGAFGKVAISGFVGGIVAMGIGGAVSEVAKAAREIATIGDEAKRAGVSAKAFQEWKFVAEQNRIGIDQMVDGLKELSLRADEFVQTGTGSAAEAFMRLGYGADELGRKLADPSALLLEIIGRLGQMDRAAQIRIADELFGGSAGERFVELLDQGEAGIRATIARANELGIVIDDELIGKAAALDRRFNEISTTVGMHLKAAIVAAADSLADFLDGLNELDKRTSLSGLRSSLADVQAQLQHNRDLIQAAKDDPTLAGRAAMAANDVDFLLAEEARILARIDELDQKATRPNATPWTPPKPPPGGFSPSSSSTKTERDKIGEVIADLQQQEAQLGRTAREQAIYNELTRAGAAANSAAGLAIGEYAGRLYDNELALSRNVEAADALRDASREMLGTFVAGMREGKSATEALGDAWQGLADKLLNSGLDGIIDMLLGGGGTAGGGILSARLGGSGGAALSGSAGLFFARGGRVRGPGSGASDSILARVSDGEFVVNAAAAAKHLPLLEAINAGRAPGFARGGRVGGSDRGPGGTPAGVQHVQVDVRVDAAPELLVNISKSVDRKIGEYDRRLPGRVNQINQSPRKR